jgi:hypothetical protein
MKALADAENDKKGQFARKNVRGVWLAIQMAQEMGAGLGRSPILLGSMQVKTKHLDFGL